MTTSRDSVGEIHAYNIDVKNREIYINEFDDSGESAGVDHRMLQNFIKNINILKNLNKEPILNRFDFIVRCKAFVDNTSDILRIVKNFLTDQLNLDVALT